MIFLVLFLSSLVFSEDYVEPSTLYTMEKTKLESKKNFVSPEKYREKILNSIKEDL